MTQHSRNAKDTILDAAEAVAIEGGAAHMTLDAVSHRAGVSKGGLLYHFPSKDHLVAAMIQRLIDTIEEARTRERAKLPPGPARELKAYLLAWLHEDPKLRKIAAGLLAAAAHNPSLMADAKKHFHSMYDQFLAGGLSPERASVVFMAAEGFRFFELMGMVELTPERRQIVVDELIGLIEG